MFHRFDCLKMSSIARIEINKFWPRSLNCNSHLGGGGESTNALFPPPLKKILYETLYRVLCDKRLDIRLHDQKLDILVRRLSVLTGLCVGYNNYYCYYSQVCGWVGGCMHAYSTCTHTPGNNNLFYFLEIEGLDYNVAVQRYSVALWLENSSKYVILC